MSSPFIPVLAALVVGLAVGLALGVLLAGLWGRSARDASVALGQELATLRVVQARTETELEGLRGRQGSLAEAAAQAVEEQRAMQRELSEARVALGETTTQLAAERESAEQRLLAERAAGAERLEAEREAAASRLALERCAADEKLLLLSEARVELGNQFKTLAGEIFEEKSKRFGEQNQVSMDQLLGPLREKLGEFQQRVEGFSNESRVGRGELRVHIETLAKLNDRLTAEASSLASALKGSSKKQGDWGEMLLERMLEDCGMRKGHEYLVQESYSREDGTRARPDVILNLPGDKHLVVDAKVSLVDYNAYCDCEDEASRAASLARHAGSVRAHIRSLKKRDYQLLYQLQSIDFVVMFVPIEPAYLLALSKDGRLWQEAWENDVLLVSPGTLFPVIRTVAHLWRQEQQHLNVQGIAERGALLYDKLAAFAADLVKVGAGLDGARDAYDKAMNKLSTGKGNAISQAEKLRTMGIKSSKQMPKELLEALDNELVRSLAEETDAAASEQSASTLFE